MTNAHRIGDISVVITTHRRANYLRIALESVLNQSLWPNQIVVSEDGREEETQNVVELYRARGLPIEHLTNVPPLGQLDNRQQAARMARSEYVAILDDDDLWGSAFLEKSYATLTNHPNCEFCCADHDIIDGHGDVLKEDTERASVVFGRTAMCSGVKEDVLLKHLSTKPFALPVTLFRRKALQQIQYFPEASGSIPDFGLFAALGVARFRAYYLPEKLASYRVHPDQQTCSRTQNGSSMVNFLRNYFKDKTETLTGAEKAALSKLYRSTVIELAIAYGHESNSRAALGVLSRYFEFGSGLPSAKRLIVMCALICGVKRLIRS